MMNKEKLRKCFGMAALGLLFAAACTAISPTKAEAKTVNVSDGEAFWNAYRNAADGDVIKLSSDIYIGKSQEISVPVNTVLTVDLNNYTIYSKGGGDNFGVGENSVLLVQNGTMDYLDTVNTSQGIIILNHVTVTDDAWLGETDTWIVNNCNIVKLCNESARVNPTADSLHPVTTNNYYSDGYEVLDPDRCQYNFENSAPAMVGSGVTWMCPSTLQGDFDQAAKDPDTYNRIILLKDATLESDATLSVSGVTLNLSGYKLTTDGKKLTMDNSDTNTITNGTINGDLDMTETTSGEVALSGLTVNGTVSNGTHPLTISDGVYDTIDCGDGKVTIKDGYFTKLEGSNYEISGGYFVDQPKKSWLADGYDVKKVEVTNGSTTYYYQVVKHASETEIRDAKEATCAEEGYTGDTYCVTVVKNWMKEKSFLSIKITIPVRQRSVTRRKPTVPRKVIQAIPIVLTAIQN